MQQPRPRQRGGTWWRLLFVLLLAVGSLFVGAAAFAPWIYYTGGHFHPLPFWQGWGKLQTQDGDYWLYVRMAPRPSKGLYLTTWVSGNAILCTPRGERVPMRLSGSMAKRLPLDVTGQWINWSVYYRPTFWSFTGAPEVPEIALKGVWGKGGIQAAVSALKDDTKNPKLMGLAKNTNVTFEETSTWMATCSRH